MAGIFPVPAPPVVLIGLVLMSSILYGFLLLDKFRKIKNFRYKKVVYAIASIALFLNAFYLVYGLLFDISLAYFFEYAFVFILLLIFSLYFIIHENALKKKKHL
jgi:hypothetical protein